MSNTFNIHKRVLAIYPKSGGFGFAVLEGTDRLIDWGVVQVKENKNERCLERIRQLAKLYEPNLVVTEDPQKGSRRGTRVKELLVAVRQLVKGLCRWKGLSRKQVHHTFRGSSKITKFIIARGIAERFPELASRLPPKRKPWMSEDPRMAMFDATALALTYVLALRRG